MPIHTKRLLKLAAQKTPPNLTMHLSGTHPDEYLICELWYRLKRPELFRQNVGFFQGPVKSVFKRLAGFSFGVA